jgi:glutathione peroxidase
MLIKNLLKIQITILFFSLTALAQEDFYSLKANDIEGSVYDFSALKGKVVLIANVASKCGFTNQYEGLQKLHDKYSSQGLVILGFPSNDFAGQEPGGAKEIKEFCKLNYDVKFQLFEKAPVSGESIQPVFKYLTADANSENGGKVLWNFEKFIVDRKGKLVDRFRSITKPESKKIVGLLEKLLKEN